MAQPTRRTLFVADPDPAVTRRVRTWLERLPAGQVPQMHAFHGAKELLRRWGYVRPDLVLIDVHFPGFDVLTALRTVKAGSPPIVILAEDASDNAPACVEGLLAGARDVFIKRGRGEGVRFAGGGRSFVRRVQELCRGHQPAERDELPFEYPGCEPPPAYGASGDGARWIRLLPGPDALLLGAAFRDFPGLDRRVVVALASLADSTRLAGGLLLPDRAGGPLIIRVPHPARFNRALQDALSRRWNRAILELQDKEPLRCGQWRMLPGRSMLILEKNGAQSYAARQAPNRIADEQRSAAAQIEHLSGAATGSLVVLLTGLPRDGLRDPIRQLLARQQIVLLHIQAAREVWQHLHARRSQATGGLVLAAPQTVAPQMAPPPAPGASPAAGETDGSNSLRRSS
jgi:chemotaxis response regulator CheB